jgi:hypothetical protein
MLRVAPERSRMGLLTSGRSAEEMELAFLGGCECCTARPFSFADYGWFIEGFDTCDLKEAKELLAELGPADNEEARLAGPAYRVPCWRGA